MIDPKELRIGNIVQSKINYLQQDHTTAVFIYNIRQIKDLKADVEAVIDGYRHFQKSTHLYYTDLDPIPLTEEWLLKFGFISIPDKQYCYRIPLAKVLENFEFCIDHKIGSDVIVFKKGSMGGAISGKYVHQLQNLYFVIMGNELEIQNPAE